MARVEVEEVGGAARAAAPVDLQEVVVVARVVVVVGVEVVATVVGLWYINQCVSFSYRHARA